MQILVTRSSMPPYEEYCEEIRELWESHWLTNSGKKHEQFRESLEEYLGVEHVALYTNGHLALENALEAMDFEPGSEIITTPFTFASTTTAILRCGFKPVFCDIDPETYTIDCGRIEALITEKTRAIFPVHVYGNLCDVERIREIADRHGLKVIYDAAHAFGVRYKGRSVAAYGDLAMFSFHSTKVFNTIEGGALCFHDDSLVQTLNERKNFGGRTPLDFVYPGGNAKMNEFQASMGICNLRHLGEEIAKREQVVACYRRLLSGVEGIKLCAPQAEVEPNYAYFPVVFSGRFDRDELYERLQQNEISARKYFYPLTCDFPYMKDLGLSAEVPTAKFVSDHVLCLPLYADLAAADAERIARIILG